jgi:hypothetical protein
MDIPIEYDGLGLRRSWTGPYLNDRRHVRDFAHTDIKPAATERVVVLDLRTKP